MQSGRIVFETKWFAVEELEGDPASGGEPYYRFKGPDAVILFALTQDRQVILVRQQRPARGHTTLEVPAGGIEAGETPLAAALRELREETGYEPGEVHVLGSGGLRLDRDNASIHGFVIFDARPVVGWNPEDGIEVVCMSLSAFGQLIREGGFEQLGALGLVLQAVLCFPNQLSELLTVADLDQGWGPPDNF